MKPSIGRTARAWCVVVTMLSTLLSVSDFSAADQGEEAIEKMAEQAEAANEALGERRFFLMPVPISNPTIGTGLGVITMRLFQAGENAPPSSFMLGGL